MRRPDPQRSGEGRRLSEEEIQLLADRLLTRGKRARRVISGERVVELECGEVVELDDEAWEALHSLARRCNLDLLATYKAILQHALLDRESRAEFLREILAERAD